MAQIHIDGAFRALLPPMSTDMRDALKDSIAEKGVTDPVTVWTERGIILDGCYRYEIALELGIRAEDIPVREMSFPDESAAKLYRIEHNLVRRQLNTYQCIMAVEACGELFEAKEDDKHKSPDNHQKSPKKLWECEPQQLKPRNDDDDELKPDTKEGVDRAYRQNEDTLTSKDREMISKSKRQVRRMQETTYKKARAAGTNEETYRQALKIKASNNQEIIGAVERGEMSIYKAYKMLKDANADPNNKLTRHRANVHKAFILLQEAYQWLSTQQFERDGENVTDAVRAAMNESMFEPEQIVNAFDSFTVRSDMGIISVTGDVPKHDPSPVTPVDQQFTSLRRVK